MSGSRERDPVAESHDAVTADQPRARPLLVVVSDPESTTCLLWHMETLLRAESPDVVLLDPTPEEEPARRARLLESLRNQLTASGARAGLERAEGDPTQAVLDRVHSLDPSLVLVAGSRARTALVTRLLRRCPAPVLVFQPEAVTSRFQRILVPLDGSDASALVLPLVSWLGGVHGSSVVLLHVSPEEGEPADVDLQPAADRLRSAGLQVQVLEARGRDPAAAILETVGLETCDLVAMTTHGRSALERWAFGSVAEKVVASCRAPLLVKRVSGLTEPPEPVATASGWGPLGGAQVRKLELKRVLLPLDGSPFSEQAARIVPRLIRGRGLHCTLLQVIPDEGSTATRRERIDEARAYLERLAGELDPAWTCIPRVVAGDPASRIVAAAREERSELVVMATHARQGPQRWLRGSVAERVLRSCETPILLCPAQWMVRAFWDEGGIRRILVPLDGSERAASVLPYAEDLARLQGAELILLKVGPSMRLVDEPARESIRDYLKTTLESERARIASEGLRVRTKAVLGDPAEQIWLLADDADLLAMTTHGRSGAARWLLGSVAEKVLRGIEHPLLVVRAHQPEPGELPD